MKEFKVGDFIKFKDKAVGIVSNITKKEIQLVDYYNKNGKRCYTIAIRKNDQSLINKVVKKDTVLGMYAEMHSRANFNSKMKWLEHLTGVDIRYKLWNVAIIGKFIKRLCKG